MAHAILQGMKKIVISLLYLLVLFSISNYIFDPTYLYYELKWLDIPMHLLGGFGVASLAFATFAYFGRPVSFLHIFIAYTIVAIGWELYEYARDISQNQAWNGWLDTTGDYINGAIGASVAYYFMKK